MNREDVARENARVRFRAWRKRMGWTQVQAAAALGRSAEWVRAAEQGKPHARIERVVTLACTYLEEKAGPRTEQDAAGEEQAKEDAEAKIARIK